MAVTEGTADKALEDHIGKIEDKEGIKIYNKNFEGAEVVEDPPTDKVSEAYSQIVEIEFVIPSVKNLITFSMVYGPSSIEIMEPDSVEINVDELQDMANSVAALVHQYASEGAGGIVTSPE